MRYSKTEFETVYTQCFPPSMRLALGLLHNEDEARDVVQEVFLKLWESDMKPDKPMAFLLRAVRNACLNRISSLDTREKIHRHIMLESPPPDTDIDDRNARVIAAIPRLLTAREQEVIALIYSKGMSYKQAATAIKASTATVNKNIVTALKKLRTHFKNSNND